MHIDTNEAATLLLQKDDILILAHKHPDGDTLGSAYALCRALLKLGKKARVECSDIIPKKYDYMLKDLEKLEFEPSFIVAVDVADTKLLGDDFERLYGSRVDLCIDHHSSNIMYAKKTCLCEDDAAAAEVVYRIICKLEVQIDVDIANCIYTGLSTDTGCFRYSNATANTHKIAAEVIDAGAKSGYINCLMFESKKLSYLKLLRLSIEGMQMHFDEKCAVVILTQKMFKDSGVNENETEAISALARQVEGVLVGVTMREKSDGTYKISVRTHSPVDAAEICAKMNGGGHKRAAGCELRLPYEQAMEVLLNHVGTAIKEACVE
ncbi:MAG: bifunctional oligoribonuclease/PAP phosphatase NrnA [Clostridia bacterium]|nr:bifunctional oligoribonuclease/PAP phosphatase NrnA [Clostridia bacterium]